MKYHGKPIVHSIVTLNSASHCEVVEIFYFCAHLTWIATCLFVKVGRVFKKITEIVVKVVCYNLASLMTHLILLQAILFSVMIKLGRR